MLPPRVRSGVEAALSRLGAAEVIRRAEPLGGGCVSPVARLETDAGSWFLKWAAPDHPPDLLAAEARGLALLGATRTVRVPEVVAAGEGGIPWLLLEWIPPGAGNTEAWSRLGRELAGLHRSGGPSFGGVEDNFIGPLPQSNAAAGSWADFWAARRLEPQLARAVDAGHFDDRDRTRFRALLRSLEDRIGLAEEEGPSPLHGDLWGGNVHMADKGGPAIIDPSSYYGHREVDLAMAELFGGFGPAFGAAYREVWPLLPEYPVRRAVYQLYYLLVHVNLFGAGYVSGCRRALQEAGV